MSGPKLTLAATVCLAAAGIAAAAIASARPSTYHVRPGESIQAAIDRAAPGDTIAVAAGVYHENLTITTDRITLRGAGASSRGTVLEPPSTPAGRVCDFEGMSGICVTGEFTPNSEEIGTPVRDVTVSDFAVRGFPRFGILLNNAVDVTIAGNETSDSGAYGTVGFFLAGVQLLDNSSHGNGQGGFYLADSPRADAVVAGNRSFNNRNVEGFGMYIRDASHGVLHENRFEGNCVGLLLASVKGPGSTANWIVRGNTVRDNTYACPPSEDVPAPLSGLGIAVIGGSQLQVIGNTVTGNQPSGETPVAGGIAIVSAKPFGGPHPSANAVRGNRMRRNKPTDVVHDGTGHGNRFVRNDCHTAIPKQLCN